MTRNDPILAYEARIPSGCVVSQTRSHFGTESSMFSRSMDSAAGSQGEHICEQEPVQRFAQKPTPSKVALGLPIVSIRRSWSIQCAVPMMLQHHGFDAIVPREGVVVLGFSFVHRQRQQQPASQTTGFGDWRQRVAIEDKDRRVSSMRNPTNGWSFAP